MMNKNYQVLNFISKYKWNKTIFNHFLFFQISCIGTINSIPGTTITSLDNTLNKCYNTGNEKQCKVNYYHWSRLHRFISPVSPILQNRIQDILHVSTFVENDQMMIHPKSRQERCSICEFLQEVQWIHIIFKPYIFRERQTSFNRT